MADHNAATADDATTDTGDVDDATTTTTDDDEVKKWKELSRKNERDLRKAQADLEKAQQSSMSDIEKAVAEAKAEGRAEATAELQRDRIRDKVKIAAGGKFADPGDAEGLLGDLDKYLVSDEIDTNAISSDIDKLLAKKPYLGAKPGNGAGEGGARGGSSSTTTTSDPLLESIERMVGVKR